MREPADLVSGLELAMLRARALAPQASSELVPVLDRLTARRGHPGDAFVAALIGGTGVGKSSVLNALVGSPVASVSPVRPHTEVPLAVVTPHPDSDLVAFLDRHGIKTVVHEQALAGLALVDLPDQDSVVAGHRRVVWSLLPEADAVVWVLDPDKYGDHALHRHHLAALADHHGRSLVVLNKIDLVAVADRPALLADLSRRLDGAGVDGAPIAMAAGRPDLDPGGIADLRSALGEGSEARSVLTAKGVADVRWAAGGLARRLGVARGATLGFDARWRRARDEAAALAAAGAGSAAAAVPIQALLTDLAAEVGGELAARVMSVVPPQAAADALAAPDGTRRRRDRKTVRARLAAALDEAVGVPLRRVLWQRAELGAMLASLVVEAHQAQLKAPGRR